MDVSFNLVNPVNPFQETTMKRLTTKDYSIDAVTAAKALLGAWLCRRLDDGTVVRRRIAETVASPTRPNATRSASGDLPLLRIIINRILTTKGEARYDGCRV